MATRKTSTSSRRAVLGLGIGALITPFLSKKGLAQSLQPGAAFHVYSSRAQTWSIYDESQPLACDTVEFDTTGCFVNSASVVIGGEIITGYCFLPTSTVLVRLFGQVLWHFPGNGNDVAAKLMLGELGTSAGSAGGEIAGEDSVLIQTSSRAIYHQTSRVQRLVIIPALTPAWFVPVYGGAPSGNTTLSNALGHGDTGMNTCNFFEGEILQVIAG